MTRELQKGSQGSDVSALQDVLNHHIRRLPPLVVDGDFGNGTDLRVREFQRSNGLPITGVVNADVNRLLYSAVEVPFKVIFTPHFRLTMPRFGVGDHVGDGGGLSLPRLIPSLEWPGPGPPPLPNIPHSLPPLSNGGSVGPMSFHRVNLLPSSSAFMPRLGPTVNVLDVKMTVPMRLDPIDPVLRASINIVDLVDDLPLTFPFRRDIIKVATVSHPGIGPQQFGFNWGIDPVINPGFNPISLNVGAQTKASYLVRLVGGERPEFMRIGMGAWGETKVEANLMAENIQSLMRVHVEGFIMLGFQGTF